MVITVTSMFPVMKEHIFIVPVPNLVSHPLKLQMTTVYLEINIRRGIPLVLSNRESSTDVLVIRRFRIDEKIGLTNLPNKNFTKTHSDHPFFKLHAPTRSRNSQLFAYGMRIIGLRGWFMNLSGD